MNMINSSKNWRRQIIFSGMLFLVVFLLELVLFYDWIIIDPAVHHISYENWMWWINEWVPPKYWHDHLAVIVTTVRTVNLLFQIVFDINLAYIFIKNNEFSVKRTRMLLAVGTMIVAKVLIHFYIKQNIDFYRLYMYSINNALTALYLLYWGSRHLFSDCDKGVFLKTDPKRT